MIKKITPNISTTIRKMVIENQNFKKAKTNNVIQSPKRAEISAPRLNLELKAESLPPEDYINARSYLEQLEYEAMVKSESRQLL